MVSGGDVQIDVAVVNALAALIAACGASAAVVIHAWRSTSARTTQQSAQNGLPRPAATDPGHPEPPAVH